MRRFIAAAAICFVASLVSFAQQQPPQQQPQPQQQQQQARPPQQAKPPQQGQRGNTPAKPVVPVAASTLLRNPDPYVGEYISLTAAVGQPLTKSTFAVEPNKKVDRDILVIAPTLQESVPSSAYVTVLGELVKFDPEDLKKKTKNYSLDLSPELVAKYKGQPAIVATAVVVNSTGVDIAKVPPPPMTPEEIEFQKIMRQVGPANTALRGAIEKMDAAAVKEQASVLSTAFTKTEAFWKTKGKTDAQGFASEAKKRADAISTDVASGNWDGVKAAAGPLGQQCAGCHGVYRERLDDGSFRMKLGSSSR